MEQSLKLGAIQAAALCVISLIIGAVAGLVSLTANLTISRAEIAANVYLSLAFILPAALVLMSLSLTSWERGQALTPLRIAALYLVAGLVGSILASLIFMVPATNIPVIFAGEKPDGLNEAIRNQIGWSQFGLVVGLTVLTAAVLGARLFLRTKATSRNSR